MAARNRKRSTSSVQTVTPGSTIRIEQPSSQRGKPSTATLVVHEINPVSGFVGFLREHAVVGLAIGFVIGTQAQTLVKQLVSSFIDPAFNLVFGQALAQRTFQWHFRGRVADFPWGAFVHTLLNFIFVLAAIYAIVKLFKLDKLDKPKEEDA